MAPTVILRRELVMDAKSSRDAQGPGYPRTGWGWSAGGTSRHKSRATDLDSPPGSQVKSMPHKYFHCRLVFPNPAPPGPLPDFDARAMTSIARSGMHLSDFFG